VLLSVGRTGDGDIAEDVVDDADVVDNADGVDTVGDEAVLWDDPSAANEPVPVDEVHPATPSAVSSATTTSAARASMLPTPLPSTRDGTTQLPYTLLGWTSTMVRRCSAITRSYSAQLSCSPPAATNTSRSNSRSRSESSHGCGSSGPASWA